MTARTPRILTHAAGKLPAGLRPGLKAKCDYFQCGLPAGDGPGQCPGGRLCRHGAGSSGRGTDLIVDASTNAERVKVTCHACLELLQQDRVQIQDAWTERLTASANRGI